MTDFEEFNNNFCIINNAIQMRNMIRWNGRDLRNKENLAEHTHLVIACAIKIYDDLPNHIKDEVNFEKLIKYCMYHDSLEMLRGDILSVTKDIIPGLREWTDTEEEKFIIERAGETSILVKEIVRLSDLMACYKFIESEIRFPSNDFVLNVYFDVKNKFDCEFKSFKDKYNINDDVDCDVKMHFSKAYENDAGMDIIMDKDCIFLPHHTTTLPLDLKFTPEKGEMALICSRTSAAKKGLIVAMSPVDPEYNGNLTAIVHNISNNLIEYKKGESFCQLVVIPINVRNCETRCNGNRTDGKLGSTGKC